MRLILVHALANAAALAAGYYWLGVTESSGGALAWSAFVALALAAFTICAYAAPLVYLRTGGPLARSWATVWRHLPALGVAAATVGAVYWLIAMARGYADSAALWIASQLTLMTRTAVSPDGMRTALDAVIWILRWMIVPALALPVAAAVALEGRKGLRWPLRPPLARFPLTALLLVCAFDAPLRLLAWVPAASGFALEAVSFAARATAAYFLLVMGWLALAFVTSRGNPRRSQSSSAVSP